MYVNVLVQISLSDDKLFTYSIPSVIKNKIQIGSRVKVPFGRTKIEGLIMGVKVQIDSDLKVKDIIEVIDDEPLLNDEMINLGKFMSETYLCSLITAYKTMLPSALKFNKNKTGIKTEKNIYIKEYKEVETRAERNIIEKLKENNKIKKSEISNKKALNKLLELNIVEEVKEEIYRLDTNTKKEEPKILTSKQDMVFKKVIQSDDKIHLIRGITGSGKTEIYMKLIENVIKSGKQAIVLVPEIAITTQLISRFRKIFGRDIAVLHSGLNDGEKYDEWRKIKRGEVSIAIGARSAVFAPFSNLGIIIIDEEHESSYKQDNNPRYNTIDIAIERCKKHDSKLILGSATPSLESYARAKTNKYNLIELLERINKKELPHVDIIDMKDELKKGHSLLSRKSIEKIKDRIQKKEQIMILLNRRGYSNYVLCRECGIVLKCPNCDISLTYHKGSNIMRCHYCGYGTNKPNKCSKCNSSHIMLMGTGIEKADEILRDMFKDLRIIRMDSDTTSKKGMYEKIINDFNDHKYDLLLGTQMIAKGLDFDNVSLVIVLNGDYSLNIPDYRSSEKTFQLLTQVAGRAGRKDLDGEIIIQTFNPDHYAITLSKNHDYFNFFNKEMLIRKRMFYPPFCLIVAVRIISKNYEEGYKEINKINKHLKNELNYKYVVLGPTSSLRINNTHKFQCIIKYKDKKLLYKVLRDIQKHYNNNKIKLEIDFNPTKL